MRSGARGERAASMFVSDLHLSPQRPEMVRVFQGFLRKQAAGARSLYILGDLFDYWIGDDDLDQPFHAAVAGALARLAETGCAIHFMPGNRDFLIGERFARAARLDILPDPTLIDQAGVYTLLVHGDTLCLDDLDYQAFRARVRDPAWQRDLLARPLEERRAIAFQLRSDSRSSQQSKPVDIMDVAPRAVEEAFRRYRCSRIIHGHTHRPGRHEHLIDDRRCERWVLGDWYRSGSYLRCDERGTCRAMCTDA